MKLGIYSLKKVVFQGEVVSLTCITVSGEITVLPHHRPLLTMLTEGVIKMVDGTQKEQFFPVKSGFLEVTPYNEAKCIVD
jgi:F-type H+-transporting ATPase subunit epsilon